MNMQSLMQQAQKMQKKLAKIEDEFQTEKFNVEAGGGAIKVTIAGDMKISEIKISEDILKGDDVDMAEDLIIAAVNQAIETVRKEKESRMSSVVGKLGSGMPGLF